jgi:predicted nucleic-acid-binding Zn-ribbon protein
MLDLSCSKCGGTLYENSIATTFEYNKDIQIMMTVDGEIDIKNAPKYMVFACVNCGFTRKISFDDYFISRQEVALKNLGRMRSDSCVQTLDHSSKKYSEDSGLSFCGLCPGIFDGDGMCTNDVMAGCFVRRRLLED